MIGSFALDSAQTKAAPSRNPERDQAAHLRIGPFAELLVGEADEERHQCGDEERRAEVVDVAFGIRIPDRGKGPPDDDEDDQADRHVDVEDPLPAEVVGDQPAEPGAEQRAEAEHGAEEALVFAAL